MSERDEASDQLTTFARATPFPVSWVVDCPTCGSQLDCPMRETDAAAFVGGDEIGNPFVACECGTVIEPDGVVVTKLASAE